MTTKSKQTRVKVDGVYVVHAKVGYEVHEARINKLFKEQTLEHEFVTDGDPSLFTPELLDTYFIPTISLSKGVLSCTLNHILAYERIVENKNNYALVFENDPFLVSNFNEQLNRIIDSIEQRSLKGIIVSLENTGLKFPSYWQANRGKVLYKASMGRAAGAYLIDYTAAKAILDNLKEKKCHTVIDWWHNRLIEDEIVHLYWAHPPLVEQGSHNGNLHSTISSKQQSWVRKLKWSVQKFYKYRIKRIFNQPLIIE